MSDSRLLGKEVSRRGETYTMCRLKNTNYRLNLKHFKERSVCVTTDETRTLDLLNFAFQRQHTEASTFQQGTRLRFYI
jgi:hypothetical protein